MSVAHDVWSFTPAQLNPRVSHEHYFGDHPEAAYYIGKIASQGEIYDQEAYTAVGRFRTTHGVYEHGFFPVKDVDELGREQDDFEDKSVHFALIKNMQYGKHRVAAVTASIRAIIGQSDAIELPAEEFAGVRFDRPKAEVSRYFAYDRDTIAQHTASLSMVRAVTLNLAADGIDTALFEIEKPVYRLLKGIGIPLEPIAEPKQVLEPGGLRMLYPLQVNVPSVVDSLEMPYKEFFKSEQANGGLGYFPKSLVGGYDE